MLILLNLLKEFNKFNNRRARMSDSYYHMTLKFFLNRILRKNAKIKLPYIRDVITDVVI